MKWRIWTVAKPSWHNVLYNLLHRWQDVSGWQIVCGNTHVYSTQRVAIKFWSHVTLVTAFCHKLIESIAQRIFLRRYFQSSDHSSRYRTPQPNILKSLLKQLREREIQNSSSLLSDQHSHCLNLSRSASLLCLCVLFLMIKLFAFLPSVSLLHKSLRALHN